MIADRCGHYGCSDECIDDYDLHIPLIPTKEYQVILEITSIEKGILYMEPDLDFELYEDDIGDEEEWQQIMT